MTFPLTSEISALRAIQADVSGAIDDKDSRAKRGQTIRSSSGASDDDSALALLGERWMLLIVDQALSGTSRFTDFCERLGIASDILSCRLNALVESGVLAREIYRQPSQRERERYVLTDIGRSLRPMLESLRAWELDWHRWKVNLSRVDDVVDGVHSRGQAK